MSHSTLLQNTVQQQPPPAKRFKNAQATDLAGLVRSRVGYYFITFDNVEFQVEVSRHYSGDKKLVFGSPTCLVLRLRSFGNVKTIFLDDLMFNLSEKQKKEGCPGYSAFPPQKKYGSWLLELVDAVAIAAQAHAVVAEDVSNIQIENFIYTLNDLQMLTRGYTYYMARGYVYNSSQRIGYSHGVLADVEYTQKMLRNTDRIFRPGGVVRLSWTPDEIEERIRTIDKDKKTNNENFKQLSVERKKLKKELAAQTVAEVCEVWTTAPQGDVLPPQPSKRLAVVKGSELIEAGPDDTEWPPEGAKQLIFVGTMELKGHVFGKNDRVYFTVFVSDKHNAIIERVDQDTTNVHRFLGSHSYHFTGNTKLIHNKQKMFQCLVNTRKWNEEKTELQELLVRFRNLGPWTQENFRKLLLELLKKPNADYSQTTPAEFARTVLIKEDPEQKYHNIYLVMMELLLPSSFSAQFIVKHFRDAETGKRIRTVFKKEGRCVWAEQQTDEGHWVKYLPAESGENERKRER